MPFFLSLGMKMLRADRVEKVKEAITTLDNVY
jgi:hypothetical protein